MPARQTIMRVITVGFGLAAGGVYAATAGFLPIPGIGQTGDSTALVLSSASTGGGAGAAGSRAQILAAPATATPETAGAIADAAAPVPAPVPAEVPAPVQLAALDAETGDLAPAAPLPVPPPADQVQADPATPPAELTDEDVALSPLGLPCGMTLVATPGPAATVAIDILTPCRPELRVQIEHSGRPSPR